MRTPRGLRSILLRERLFTSICLYSWSLRDQVRDVIFAANANW